MKLFDTRKSPLLLLIFFSGCATATQLFNPQLDVPPEFDQKVILEVSDRTEMFQAPRSVYDVGDLQSFHTQQTLPILVEDSFKEIFGEVEVMESGPKSKERTPKRRNTEKWI